MITLLRSVFLVWKSVENGLECGSSSELSSTHRSTLVNLGQKANRGGDLKVTNNDSISPPNLWRCSAALGLPRVDTTGNQTVCELDSNGLKIPNIGKSPDSCLSYF